MERALVRPPGPRRLLQSSKGIDSGLTSQGRRPEERMAYQVSCDGVYFHVAPLAKASHTPAAGVVKVADDPITIRCSDRSEREQHSAAPRSLGRDVGGVSKNWHTSAEHVRPNGRKTSEQGTAERCHLPGNCPETGFEEIGALAGENNITFPRTGLLDRDSFRVHREPEQVRVALRAAPQCRPRHLRVSTLYAL